MLRRNSDGGIENAALNLRPKWDRSLKPQSKAISVTFLLARSGSDKLSRHFSNRLSHIQLHTVVFSSWNRLWRYRSEILRIRATFSGFRLSSSRFSSITVFARYNNELRPELRYSSCCESRLPSVVMTSVSDSSARRRAVAESTVPIAGTTWRRKLDTRAPMYVLARTARAVSGSVRPTLLTNMSRGNRITRFSKWSAKLPEYGRLASRQARSPVPSCAWRPSCMTELVPRNASMMSSDFSMLRRIQAGVLKY